MITLSAIGVEDGAIVAVAPNGERFRVTVDAAVRGRLLDQTTNDPAKRLSPREIQAHVRAGMSPQQVADLTGAPMASIQRFVGPVLAELAYVLDSALQVRLPPEAPGGTVRSFGSVMTERLSQLAATGVRWSSSKEPAGWTVAVAFSADGVQHDARWRFDPKRLQLEPANVEASTLSQDGTPAALTPRLRALEPTAPVAIVSAPIGAPPAAPSPARHEAPPAPDRFDSDAFRFPEPLAPKVPAPAEPAVPQPVPAGSARGDDTALRPPQPLRRVEDPSRTPPPTTGQLESLSRRRGQREPAVDTASLPVTRALDVVDADDEPGDLFAPRQGTDRRTEDRKPFPVATLPQAQEPASPGTPVRSPERPSGAAHRQTLQSQTPQGRGDAFRRRPQAWSQETDETGVAPTVEPPAAPAARPRRGRTSMPSWDEIVFGRDD